MKYSLLELLRRDRRGAEEDDASDVAAIEAAPEIALTGKGHGVRPATNAVISGIQNLDLSALFQFVKLPILGAFGILGSRGR
jgi:hypothetical protein